MNKTYRRALVYPVARGGRKPLTYGTGTREVFGLAMRRVLAVGR